MLFFYVWHYFHLWVCTLIFFDNTGQQQKHFSLVPPILNLYLGVLGGTNSENDMVFFAAALVLRVGIFAHNSVRAIIVFLL